MRYDFGKVASLLVDARASASILNRMPYLHRWIEQVLEEQLRLEAVGTSRIEGAEFTQSEQDEALDPAAAPRAGMTRSQRQLWAANRTYRWLRSCDANRPVNAEFVFDVHSRIVTGCDDDHCEPGSLRRPGSNVIFGIPSCRGAEGGDELAGAFGALVRAVNGEFRGHDPIIQALAAHYHVGAMHPFGDGNGRTARALEAFMLRKARVNDMVMVGLSNYYYEHKEDYLDALYASRVRRHDLTPFLEFALPAVVERCDALANEIVTHNKRTLYREFARSLFGRLRSPRRRVLAERQLQVMEALLDAGPLGLPDLVNRVLLNYAGLKFPERGVVRDLGGLLDLQAIELDGGTVAANLDWPQRFSESELLERYESMPSAAYSGPAVSELSRLLGNRSPR